MDTHQVTVSWTDRTVLDGAFVTRSRDYVIAADSDRDAILVAAQWCAGSIPADCMITAADLVL